MAFAGLLKVAYTVVWFLLEQFLGKLMFCSCSWQEKRASAAVVVGKCKYSNCSERAW